MGRKRKGDPVHGWLVLDKPLEITSTQAVSVVKRLYNAQKAGHGGTLDPLATGILPIAFGEATKTVSFAMDGQKTYRFTLRFGEARSTDDLEGDILETSAVRPDPDALMACLPRFMGDILQTPPAYSAIKVNGKRAYDLARADQAVDLAPRQIRIDDLKVIARPSPEEVLLECVCGKGTYIRSLARDIALALGTVGHVSMLRRIKVGSFEEKHAISLEDLKTVGHSADLLDRLLPLETALDDIPAVALSEAEAARLKSGQFVSLMRQSDSHRARSLIEARRQGHHIFSALCQGKLVALTHLEAGQLKPVRVLNH